LSLSNKAAEFAHSDLGLALSAVKAKKLSQLCPLFTSLKKFALKMCEFSPLNNYLFAKKIKNYIFGFASKFID
jgi:hypothetical protein